MTRLIDIFLSSCAIVFLSPLLILLIVLLKFTGEGEIFYFQTRIGLSGSKFRLFKFATMLKDSESFGSGSLTIDNDPRILPLGKFLRDSKLNELPQLFNIFLGDMSFIGPRPLTLQTFNVYPLSLQATISSVRPGLSGIGSIVFRNEESLLPADPAEALRFYSGVIAPYKASLEEWYINRASIIWYFILFFMTIYVVAFPRNRVPIFFLKDLPPPPIELAPFLSL